MVTNLVVGLLALSFSQATNTPEWAKWTPGKQLSLSRPFLHVEKGKATLDSASGVHTLTSTLETGRDWDLQLLTKIPLTDYVGLSRLIRVEFSARASKQTNGRVKINQAKEPWEKLGLEQPLVIPTEWNKYSFDVPSDPEGVFAFLIMQDGEAPHPGAYCSVMFQGIRGEVQVKGLSIRSIAPDYVGPTGSALSNESEVFQWNDQLADRFVKKDLPAIRSVWDAKFAESWTWNSGESEVRGTTQAERRWAAQILHGTRFTNGPAVVCVKSITTNGTQMVVEGIWGGSWRLGEWDDLSSAGAMWDAKFKQTWVKGPVGWTLRRFENTGVDKPDYKTFKQSHAALKAKLVPKA